MKDKSKRRLAACFWIGVIIGLGGYEFWAISKNRRPGPPLTKIVVENMPWWTTVPFLAWLTMHFAVEYAKTKANKHDDIIEAASGAEHEF